MKTRHTRYKNKTLVTLVALFTTLLCVCVGFASWLVTGGSNALALGQVQADDVLPAPQGDDVDVISITDTANIEYGTAYGFVNDGTYKNNVNLTGACSFDIENGKSCFTSLRSSTKSFKLDVTLTTALSNGFLSNGFTCDSISLTSTNFASCSHGTINSDASISTTFTINCNNTTADFTFDFAIHLVWSGSSFPNLSSSSIQIAFLAKENA